MVPTWIKPAQADTASLTADETESLYVRTPSQIKPASEAASEIMATVIPVMSKNQCLLSLEGMRLRTLENRLLVPGSNVCSCGTDAGTMSSRDDGAVDVVFDDTSVLDCERLARGVCGGGGTLFGTRLNSMLESEVSDREMALVH